MDEEFITEINSVQSLWKAGAYPEHAEMTNEQMTMMLGGRK